MTGTSPFTFQSPSYHSSSYLPKLEAEFCRDFSCCGIPLPSLHDLLRHYEEHHAQQMPMNNENDNQDSHGGPGGHDVNRQQARHPQQQNAANMIGGMGGIQYEMMRQQQMQRQRQQEEDRGNNQDDQPEGEIAGDMEMDDDEMTPPPNNTSLSLTTPQAHLSQQHYSHPTTPATMNMPSYHNTPILANSQLPHLTNQPSHFSPESSVPGTPLATDMVEYGFPQNLTGFQNQQGGVYSPNLNYGGGMESTGDMSLDLCIDEPAKRLFSPGGQAAGMYSQAQMQQYLNNNPNELAKKIADGGVAQAPTMPAALMQTEEKPFKCPVIGCEKAYKNQNGLKYHKAVSNLYPA